LRTGLHVNHFVPLHGRFPWLTDELVNRRHTASSFVSPPRALLGIAPKNLRASLEFRAMRCSGDDQKNPSAQNWAARSEKISMTDQGRVAFRDLLIPKNKEAAARHPTAQPLKARTLRPGAQGRQVPLGTTLSLNWRDPIRG
jgi:hypothetical protein